MDKFDFFGDLPVNKLPLPQIPDSITPKSQPPKQSSSLKLVLPPDILLRILRYLPITSLSSFACACRRFKVLVYDDELWEQHLKTLCAHKEYDANDITDAPLDSLFVNSKLTGRTNNDNAIDGAVNFDVDSLVSTQTSPITPNETNSTGNLLEFAITKARSQKALSLIPGLPLDSFSQKPRSASTGIARAIFKRIYTDLLPYYIDFRNRKNDSRLFKEYADPTEQAKMLKRLMNFSKLNISLDSDQIYDALATTIEYFENASLLRFELAYDAQNPIEMKKWANILLELNGGVSCIPAFIQKNSIFFDHLFDPMDNFIQTSSSSGSELSFTPISDFFGYLEEDFKKQASLIDQVFLPESDVFYAFVEKVVEDVITDYISTLLVEARSRDIIIYFRAVRAAYLNCKHISEVLWKQAEPGLSKIRAEDVIYRMFEPMMNSYLNDELTMVKMLNDEEVDKWNQKVSLRGKLLNKTISEQQSLLNNYNREVYKRNYLSSFRKILKLPTTKSRNSSSVSFSQTSFASDKRSSVASLQKYNNHSSDTDTQLTSNSVKSNKLQQLLSLETALQMIHTNRESLNRIGVFVGYPGEMGHKIYRSYCVYYSSPDAGYRTYQTRILHVSVIIPTDPGRISFTDQCYFTNSAIKRLDDQKSNPEVTSRGLTPLVELFELVHIADLMHQMVQVYYDEEMKQYVDKSDFLNVCNKEKKAFERVLDECVADSLNKVIQILMDHLEFTLSAKQQPEDFRPPADASLDLIPTKACIEAVECLSKHTKILVGCTDKHILDVFFQEIGLRFFGVLTKHLKKFVVNTSGGFQIISTLQQPAITPHFIALKELGNIFIISNARDISLFIRETERFNGVFYAEDIYEFCQKREDWMIIKKAVEKELYGLKAEDC
ncbi:17497_t:CDS:10, partial [Acaulospora morrowiae]